MLLCQITVTVKEFDPEFLFLHYFTVFTRSACEDIWRFMYTFCRNLTALGIRNVLRSVEPSIQVQFLRFLYVLPCATHTTHQKTEEMLSLPYIWRKDKRSAFEIWQGLQALPVGLGTRVRAASAINNQYNPLPRQHLRMLPISLLYSDVA